MASFHLARSSRLFKRFACASSNGIGRPTLDSAYASSHCSKVTSFSSKWKRQSVFLDIRQISCSAFVNSVACEDAQEDTVDGKASVMKIKSEFAAERGNVSDYKSNGGDDEKLLAINVDADADVILDTIDGCEIDAHTEDGDTSVKGVKTADKVSDEMNVGTSVDSAPARVVMHVAHMLGIIEYENLSVLEALTSCTEDELFSNLSFLLSIGMTEKQLTDTISMHPSLMAMDLNKSLSRVMRCIQKLELDSSYLKQVLIVEPEVVPLLANRALQERVKALRELDFAANDIATLLKLLGCNQLKRFLSLPVEKFEPTVRYITDDIGVRSGDAIKLISSSPSVLLRDVEQEYVSKMKVLKEVFDELKKVKKLFVHLPELMARKTDVLEETVMFLKDMVKDLKKLRDLIEGSPVVLTHRKSGIEPVAKYLQGLGFDSTTTVAMIAREPYLVECGSERLHKHVEFLKTKNFDENAVRSLMENSTGMFFKSLLKRVAPKIEFLENQGITGESLQKYIQSRPQVVDRSLRKSMSPSLDFLLSLGFEKNSSSLKNALKVTLPHSHKSLQSRIDHLISLGIEAPDVHKMVREAPSILAIPDSSLKKRVDFLVKVMKHPVQDLVKCPSFLLTSINKSIMPRLKVFEWLKSKGLLKKFSLSTLVETDEAAFVKKFVQAHPEVLSIYKGSPQS
eukprot:c29123_g1_i1 orf=145-2190(+)